ncbi:MAG: ATP-binding protein [Ruminococcus sp.]|nr:ATP-binding protein [Ruminococcus sp.]
MFIGRKKELDEIKSFLSKDSGCMMIYGKRKVGKTTLINNALKGYDNTVYYECIKDSLKANVDGLVDVLLRNKILPSRIEFASFQDLFQYLNSLNETFNIVIDEYPYLKATNKPETVDSVFQSVIDNSISNIHLFISGSHISMMRDLLNEKNALYGRFSHIIQLNELNYIDTSEFYTELDAYDKVGLYSVFGGSPFVNEFIDNTKSLKENIISNILNPSHSVYNYADNLLVSDFSNVSGAERIFSALKNGKKKYSEIEQTLRIEKNGALSKMLKPLLNMELIVKKNPINRPDDKKKTYYEINDNLLRFYYTYVYKNKSALQVIGAEAFYEEYISDSIITFISHRFEEICRDYFSIQVKRAKLKGIRNIGTYYYDDSVNKINGEFDVVLQRKDSFEFYEAKYYQSPMSLSDMKKEEIQIRNIYGLNVSKIGFVSIRGFESTPKEYVCISGSELYK